MLKIILIIFIKNNNNIIRHFQSVVYIIIVLKNLSTTNFLEINSFLQLFISLVFKNVILILLIRRKFIKINVNCKL